MNAKLFLLLETITKTILHSYAANFLQICVNFHLSHIQLAVNLKVDIDLDKILYLWSKKMYYIYSHLFNKRGGWNK